MRTKEHVLDKVARAHEKYHNILYHIKNVLIGQMRK